MVKSNKTRLFQLVEGRQEDFSAWNKAPGDVAAIVKDMGGQSITLMPPAVGRKRLMPLALLLKMVVFLKALFTLKRGSALIIQSPPAYWGRMIFREILLLVVLKNIRLVVIVHDIVGLRDGDGVSLHEGSVDAQDALFRRAHRIIVHNEIMRQWFKKRGFDQEKIIPLGIFDYLVADGYVERRAQYDHRIVVAGNLSPTATGFLSDLAKLPQITWELYGPGFAPRQMADARIDYRGIAKADDLPGLLRGGFGLIWYGDSLEACRGRMREYSKLINPHKLSLYLAAGLPVVAWDEMAIAGYVREKNVGVVASSVYEAAKKICEMSGDEYEVMAENARTIGRELRDGHYMRTAIKTALK